MSICVARRVLGMGLFLSLVVCGTPRPAAGQENQPLFTWLLPDWQPFGLSADAMSLRRLYPAEIPREFAALYWSLAALQGLDAHSTRRAVEAGAREASPLMAPFAGSSPMLLAVKGGATIAAFHAAERFRKTHPRMAMAMMIGINAAYSAVVVHNYRTAGAPARLR